MVAAGTTAVSFPLGSLPSASSSTFSFDALGFAWASVPPLPSLLQKGTLRPQRGRVCSGVVHSSSSSVSLPTSDTLPGAPPAAAGRSVGWYLSVTQPKSTVPKKGRAPMSAWYTIPDLFNSMRRPMLAGRSRALTPSNNSPSA